MLAALTPHRRGRGITLVEILVVLAITGILAAMAMPSLNEFIMRKRVEGIANEVAADMRLARVNTNQQDVHSYINFRSNGDVTCYTVYTNISGGSCDCRRGAGSSCRGIFANSTPPTELKTLEVKTGTGLTLTPSPSSDFYFNRITQMSSVESFSITVEPAESGGKGGAMKVVINAAGTPSLCSVSGHASYKAC